MKKCPAVGVEIAAADERLVHQVARAQEVVDEGPIIGGRGDVQAMDRGVAVESIRGGNLGELGIEPAAWPVDDLKAQL